MTPELIAFLFFMGVLLLVGTLWRFKVPRTGFTDVQVVYEEDEWCVYGIGHSGEKVLVDAFPHQTDALACAYKLAEKQNLSGQASSEDTETR
ncbi:hypothetical protein [Deinococcus cellulosilyticus]|uniref:Uncharacterized protein n=1 Tax=Deinococcus cellulosilyticus (strain DSM 18568 / NBRC 106333 / KACC 11606 / 5516J-15) TaxID=1223518 RepID=A0A511MV39_DEIC1|nr:hypothetical protein [Deinococcus cellulosilyticus]GEM44450.1 hypothetical protein DC3_00850 [Deinococcus cellulosilyticus NBRC 106333 = KACC 11606]